MYIFGGRNDEHQKLNDLWRFDIAASTWSEIKAPDAPLERCGHSCDVYEGQFMVIFGGIFEITKELNDMHIFDFTKKRWVTLFEETSSPVRNLSPGGHIVNFEENPYMDSSSQGSPAVVMKKKLPQFLGSSTKKGASALKIKPTPSKSRQNNSSML